MAATLKQLLLPTHHTYTPLPTHNSPRTASLSSTSTSTTTMDSSSTLNEKFPALNHPTTKPLTTRVSPRLISDATIGLSDGLTVPFALTAGLSALNQPNLVIYAGMAELIAGGISMGLGGYLGARSEAEAYTTTLAEMREVVRGDGGKAGEMAREAFEGYDFSEEVLGVMVERLGREEEMLVGFLMRFRCGMEEGEHARSRAYLSGLTISMGYFFGGLVPLMPYLFFATVADAFLCSVVVMGIALFAFGWAKTALVGERNRRVCLRNGVQMVVLGGVAAGAAMGCVKAVGS